jgi:hypothetical protein
MATMTAPANTAPAKTEQVRIARQSPAYWRVTIDNPPINVMGPEMVKQFQEVILSRGGKNVALNLGLPWRVQEGIFISPKIGIIEFNLRIVSDVARLSGCKRQQVTPQRDLLGRPVRPEGPPGCPVHPEAFVVSNRILDDEGLHALWMRQCHPKTNRTSVVLHV